MPSEPEPETEASDENTIGEDDAKRHIICLKNALTAKTPDDRRQALIDGLTSFGGRFVLGITYRARLAGNQGPFEDLRMKLLEILTHWLHGNRLTDRVGESQRRAQMASFLLQSRNRGMKRLAAKCIMALPEGDSERNTELVHNTLLRFTAERQAQGDVEGQLRGIGDILEFELESRDGSLELIEQGSSLINQVPDGSRQGFRVKIMNYYETLAYYEFDQRDAEAGDHWAKKAEETLDQILAEDPDFFRTAAGRNLAAGVLELNNKSSEAAAMFASVVDTTEPGDSSYQLAATIESRYCLEQERYERTIKILSPIISILEEKYLLAVEDSDIADAGAHFSEMIWNLAFAHAHLGNWDEAIRNLERGKSLRWRYKAALRRTPSTKRLLELETKLYALSRGVPIEAGEFNKPATEDWLGQKVSLNNKILEAYRTERPKISAELLESPSINDIAGVLEKGEAVVILGVTNGGTLIAVICHGDKDLPSGRFLIKEMPLSQWVPFFEGENKDGWIIALGAPELRLDHRPGLTRLLEGVDKIIGQTLKPLLQKRKVRRITIIPHLWFHLVPFWALPSLDKCDVTIAASAVHFLQGHQMARVETRKALVVADPTRDLAGSLAEAESVTRNLSRLGFEVEQLEREKALENEVVKALPGASVFHFSGHGRSDMDNPTRSALLVYPDLSNMPDAGRDPFEHFLAVAQQWREEGEERSAVVPGVGRLCTRLITETQTLERRLEYGERGTLWGRYREGTLRQLAEMWTMGDILVQSPLGDCRLAFLSACEAGGGGFATTVDEYSGLPAALQFAGVSAIISSLWPVSDALTSLYVDLFYEALAQEAQPANLAALIRKTGQRLRGMKKGRAVVLLNRLRRRTSSLRARSTFEAFAARVKKGDQFPFSHPFDWAAFYVTGTSNILFSEEVSHDHNG